MISSIKKPLPQCERDKWVAFGGYAIPLTLQDYLEVAYLISVFEGNEVDSVAYTGSRLPAELMTSGFEVSVAKIGDAASHHVSYKYFEFAVLIHFKFDIDLFSKWVRIDPEVAYQLLCFLAYDRAEVSSAPTDRT